MKKILVAFLFVSFTVSAVEVPQSVKQKYRYLYQEQIKTLPDGSKSFHKARLFHRAGVDVLYLKGDRFEMAFQHGRLLRQKAQKGALYMAPKLVPNIIKNAFGNRPLLNAIVQSYVQSFVTGKLTNHLLGMANGEDQLSDAYGLSEGAQIPVDDVIRGLLNPDIMMILAARNIKEDDSTRVNVSGFASNCSDFALWDKYTADGNLLIGRNMDFPLNGYYDKYPTAVYFDPEDDKAQRYVAMVSAGVHNAGLQSMNESGLFLGVHTIPTNEINMEGVPAFLIATEVIRYARTFDQAIEFFKEYNVNTGYTYTLVSTREKKVAAIELSGLNTKVRYVEGGLHAQSNHFRHPFMQDKNLYINHSVDEDSLARQKRIEDRVIAAKKVRSAKEAMSILADQVDPFSSSRATKSLGNTVAVHTTLTSVVVDSSKGKFYMANGMAPTSQSTFVELPLPENFSLDSFAKEEYETVLNDEFKVQHPKKALAEQNFIQAKMAYEYHNDVNTARKFLQEVVKLEPENAHYQFNLGVFQLKSGHFQHALGSFRKMLSSSPSTHQTHLAYYYMGRIYSHWRYKWDAINAYEKVISAISADSKLLEAAFTAYRKTSNWGGMTLQKNKLPIMMQQSDMQHY